MGWFREKLEDPDFNPLLQLVVNIVGFPLFLMLAFGFADLNVYMNSFIPTDINSVSQFKRIKGIENTMENRLKLYKTDTIINPQIKTIMDKYGLSSMMFYMEEPVYKFSVECIPDPYVWPETDIYDKRFLYSSAIEDGVFIRTSMLTSSNQYSIYSCVNYFYFDNFISNMYIAGDYYEITLDSNKETTGFNDGTRNYNEDIKKGPSYFLESLEKEKISKIDFIDKKSKMYFKLIDGTYTFYNIDDPTWDGYFDEKYNFVIPITEYNEEMFRKVFISSGNAIEVYNMEDECIKRLIYAPNEQKVITRLDAEYDDIISRIVYPNGKEIRYYYDSNILTSASEEYLNGVLVNRKTYAYSFENAWLYEAVYEGADLNLVELNRYSLCVNPLRCNEPLCQNLKNHFYLEGTPSSLLWKEDKLKTWKNVEE